MLLNETHILHGVGIDLVLYSDRLVMRKQGVLAAAFDVPDREVALEDVLDITLTDGYTIWHRYFKCSVREDAGLPVLITYHRENESEAERMKALIEESIAAIPVRVRRKGDKG